MADRLFSHDDGCEDLVHDNIHDAVERWAEDLECTAPSLQETVRLHGPLTIHEFARKEATERLRDRAVDGLGDHLAEWFMEHFGNPEGDMENVSDEVRALLRKAVDLHVEKTHIWACEKVGTHVLSADEVLRILGAEVPNG